MSGMASGLSALFRLLTGAPPAHIGLESRRITVHANRFWVITREALMAACPIITALIKQKYKPRPNENTGAEMITWVLTNLSRNELQTQWPLKCQKHVPGKTPRHPMPLQRLSSSSYAFTASRKYTGTFTFSIRYNGTGAVKTECPKARPM
ncbi:hypothetical protein B0H19DRAFT_1083613 [Mycena capillaripes]|nr:hypothetical protein B0H19DRAFT_1083613 [Mycena capillaripes]